MSSSDSESPFNADPIVDEEEEYAEGSGDEEVNEDTLEYYLEQEDEEKIESVDIVTALERLDVQMSRLEDLVEPSVWSKVVDFRPPSVLPHLRIGFLGNSGLGKTTTMNHILDSDGSGLLRQFLPSSGSNAATAALCEIVGWKHEVFRLTVEFITWDTWLKWYESARNDLARALSSEGLNAASPDSVEFLESILSSFWHGKELDALVSRKGQDSLPDSHWANKSAENAIPANLRTEAFPSITSSTQRAHFESRTYKYERSKDASDEGSFEGACKAVSDAIIKYCFAGQHKKAKKAAGKSSSSKKAGSRNATPTKTSSASSSNSSEPAKKASSSPSPKKKASSTEWKERIWPLVSKVTVCGPFPHLAEHGYSLIDIPGNNDEVGLRQERYSAGRRMADSICYFPNPKRYGMASELLSMPSHQRNCLIITSAMSLEEFPSPNLVLQALRHEHSTEESQSIFDALKILPVENVPKEDDPANPDKAKRAAAQLIAKVRHHFAVLASRRRQFFLSYVNSQWNSLCRISQVSSAESDAAKMQLDYESWKKVKAEEMKASVKTFKISSGLSAPKLHDDPYTHYATLQASMRHGHGYISWSQEIASIFASEDELASLRAQFEALFRRHLGELCGLDSFPKAMFDTQKLLELLMERSDFAFWDSIVRDSLSDFLEDEYRPTWRTFLAAGKGCRDVMISNINSWWTRMRGELSRFVERGLEGTLLAFLEDMMEDLTSIMDAMVGRLQNIAALQEEQVKKILRPLSETIEVLPPVPSQLKIVSPQKASNRKSYLYAMQIIGGAWMLGYTWNAQDPSLAAPHAPRLHTFSVPAGNSTISAFAQLKHLLAAAPHHYLFGESPVVVAPESVVFQALASLGFDVKVEEMKLQLSTLSI